MMNDDWRDEESKVAKILYDLALIFTCVRCDLCQCVFILSV